MHTPYRRSARRRVMRCSLGNSDQAMQIAAWDLTPYVGKKVFIKVVDNSTTGWGHVTVDDFQFDAKVLTEYPESLTN